MRLAGSKFLVSMMLIALGNAILIFPDLVAGQQDKQETKSESSKSLVLQNATIHSLGPEGTFDGSIVVTDGKIAAIGADVEVPEDATVYDLKGYVVTPGLIESRSKLWVSTAAHAESNSRCELNIVDAIDPWSEDWTELASQGITAVYAQPASGGLIGGYGAVLRVGPYTTIDDIVLKQQVAVQAALGVPANSTSQSRHTLYGQLERLLDRTKKEIEKEEKEKEKKEDKKKKDSKKKGADKKSGDKKEDKAKGKGKKGKGKKPSDKKDKKDADKDDEKEDEDKKEDKDEDKKKGKDKDGDKKKDKDGDKDEDGDKKEDKDDEDEDKDGKKGDKKDDDEKSDDDEAEKPDRKLTQAQIALRKVLNNELPLFIEVRHSDTLEKALKLAEKFEIQIVIDGIRPGKNHVQKLIDSGFPMVVGPLYSGSNNDSDWKKDTDQPLAAIKESLFSISGFAATPRSSRMLRTHAAMAMRMGLDHDSVLAAITSRPARALGVSDHVGTLEVGKFADIAVFNGDPLDPCAQARLVLSQGRVAFESEAQPIEMVEAKEAKSLPSRLPESYAVKSTRMLQGGKFVEGQFQVKEGKIVSVGGEVGDGVEVFDLGDTIVTPGLVIASSMLGQGTDIIDSNDSDTSHLRAVDAIDPAHEKVKQALAGGFVHVGVSPGTTNASPGVMGHMRLSANDYVASPTIASQFVLTGSARVNGRYPSSFNGQLQVIVDLMQGKPLASNLYLTPVMQRLLDKEKVENVAAVVKGERRAIIAADSHLEIRSAIRLAKEKGINVTLHSSGRVGEFAEQMAENKLGMIVPPFNGGEYDSQIEQFVQVQKAGVPIGFAGDSAEQIRLAAALLVSRGLDAEAALLGLTEGGGKIVGMEKAGIEKEAFADFVVWSGSPLNVAAHPLNVVVDGQVVTQK